MPAAGSRVPRFCSCRRTCKQKHCKVRPRQCQKSMRAGCKWGEKSGHSVNKVLCLYLYRQSRGLMQHEQRVVSKNKQTKKGGRQSLFLAWILTLQEDTNQITCLIETIDKWTKEGEHRLARETLKGCSGTFSAVLKSFCTSCNIGNLF